MSEQKHLDKINKEYSMHDKDHNINLFRSEIIMSRCVGPSILELGCADGMLTPYLVKKFQDVTCVDASSVHTELVKKKAPNAKVITSLFEELDLDVSFDTIILGHVLEHVNDPVQILRHLKNFANRKTKFIITVPNANSIHRQIGAAMGMLSRPNELNDDDIRIGHRRVYYLSELIDDIEKAGMEVKFTRGIAVKPLSNVQMNSWPSELRQAFFSISDNVPADICGELLIEACIVVKA